MNIFINLSTVKSSRKFHILCTQIYFNAPIFLNLHDKAVKHYGLITVFSLWVSVLKHIQITSRKAE